MPRASYIGNIVCRSVEEEVETAAASALRAR